VVSLPGLAGPGLLLSESLEGSLGNMLSKVRDRFSSGLALLLAELVAGCMCTSWIDCVLEFVAFVDMFPYLQKKFDNLTLLLGNT
jgi:hypothetical protein